MDAVIAAPGGLGDWPSPSEQRRFIAEVDATARVMEVSTPKDWHRLCVAFPRRNNEPYTPLDGEGTLSPDWSRLTEQWDGIHLTFAGLLTTPFVRYSTAAGATMLWSWDSEGTTWAPGAFLKAGAQLETLGGHDIAFPAMLD